MSVAVEKQTQETTHESQVHYNLALDMMSRSRHLEALEHLDGARRMAPRNTTYMSIYGLCIALAGGDFDRALWHCMNAVRAEPFEVTYWVNLGKVHKLRGDNAQAHRSFLKAWSVRSRHPAVATELVRMGVRRRPFFTFLPRRHPVNRYLGVLRAVLERKLVGHRQS